MKPIDDSARQADSIRTRLATLATDYKKFGLKPEPPAAVAESYERFSDPGDELFTRLSRMEPPLRLLEALIIPKSMKGRREAWIFIVLIGLCVLLAAVLTGEPVSIGAGAVGGAVVAFLLRTWLAKLSKTQLERLYVPLTQSLADADLLTVYCRTLVDNRLKGEKRRLTTRREDDLKRADDNYRVAFVTAEAKRDEKLRKINEVYAERMVEIQTAQQRDMRDAIDVHDRRMAEIRTYSESAFPKLEGKYKALKERIATSYSSAWQEMASRWRDGMVQAASLLEGIQREVDLYCPAWNAPEWSERGLPKVVPPAVRFGTVPIELAALPQGVSPDPKLMEGVPTSFVFPALRPFPASANLLIETPSEGRTAALEVLQASMFRLLTSLPPAQVRFTIVDPIGIGRTLARSCTWRISTVRS